MSKSQSALLKALFTSSPVPRPRKAPSRTARAQKKAQVKTGEAPELDRLNQIYFVAARLFCERGFDGTSMSDIADEIGITKAGIYHFIPGGKKDLLFAIISFGLDTLDRAVIEPAKAITDAEQRLRAIIANHVELVTSGSTPEGVNPVTVVVDEVAGLSAAHQRKIAQRKRAYVDLIRTTLEELKTEGKLQEVDVTVVAFSLIGMILWLARWFRPDGKLTKEQVAEEICKMALGGILRPQARQARK